MANLRQDEEDWAKFLKLQKYAAADLPKEKYTAEKNLLIGLDEGQPCAVGDIDRLIEFRENHAGLLIGRIGYAILDCLYNDAETFAADAKAAGFKVYPWPLAMIGAASFKEDRIIGDLGGHYVQLLDMSDFWGSKESETLQLQKNLFSALEDKNQHSLEVVARRWKGEDLGVIEMIMSPNVGGQAEMERLVAKIVTPEGELTSEGHKYAQMLDKYWDWLPRELRALCDFGPMRRAVVELIKKGDSVNSSNVEVEIYNHNPFKREAEMISTAWKRRKENEERGVEETYRTEYNKKLERLLGEGSKTADATREARHRNNWYVGIRDNTMKKLDNRDVAMRNFLSYLVQYKRGEGGHVLSRLREVLALTKDETKSGHSMDKRLNELYKKISNLERGRPGVARPLLEFYAKEGFLRERWVDSSGEKSFVAGPRYDEFATKGACPMQLGKYWNTWKLNVGPELTASRHYLQNDYEYHARIEISDINRFTLENEDNILKLSTKDAEELVDMIHQVRPQTLISKGYGFRDVPKANVENGGIIIHYDEPPARLTSELLIPLKKALKMIKSGEANES